MTAIATLSAAETPVLAVHDVSKTYRNGRGVRQVSFDVRKGDVFGLFGPNGAGKTTLLKIVTGLGASDEGSVHLFGIPAVERYEAAMARVSCVVESADAYDYLSARDNLKLAARFYPDLPGSRIDEVLELVDLSAYRREKVKGFSLGMKQRLALAGALLSRPELVILDEPTNGLDIEGMAGVRRIVGQLSREQGVAFLISSHMIREMETICNRMAIMYGGAIIQQGEVRELVGEGALEPYYLEVIRKAKEGGVHA